MERFFHHVLSTKPGVPYSHADMDLYVTAVSLVVLYILKRLLLEKGPSEPLPPGPKPLPIVGNIRDLPSGDRPDWLHWLKHKDIYGPISTVTVFGQRIIILNEIQLAMELLEKRSAVHSDRPEMPFARLCGWADTLAMLGYSKRFNAYRRNIHREIGSKVSVARFTSTQEVEVRRFLLRVLDNPQDLLDHTRKLAGAVILKITYGYSIEPFDRDPLVDLVDEAVEGFSLAARPGTWLVDFAPILRYIPAWFPGAGFQRTAKAFRKLTQAHCEVPFAFVKQQMSQPNYEPSYVSHLLGEKPIPPGSAEEIAIKWSAAALYGGGADTTVSAISSFFLTMALFPEAQRTAQEEIDRVIGPHRLPGYADREKLPYVEALVKEALRWHPVGPMGIPHRSINHDVCNGYFIPKGSIILANIWAFCHDPTEYANPMAFQPERFLGKTPERDPHHISFGFGRRVCPGRIIADANIYLTIVQALAAFTTGKVMKDGKEADINPEFLPGVISHPAPFEVDIKVRSKQYEELIRAVETEHPWENKHTQILRDILVEAA
ncbi:hypothetical protein AOCH_005390 [Aspergillus ochraceoroseus]|uniref:O-methylsterigmatocystin oxidoreductase n=1 Tax=Aspergillus ochraceoroseus TaxID=138278 RepID=A0A0F8W1S6_9EURO|nr:hypothetical protein AOCH_005390 [Aspergillus ochraceoroseus]